jgi:hypothetical protein
VSNADDPPERAGPILDGCDQSKTSSRGSARVGERRTPPRSSGRASPIDGHPVDGLIGEHLVVQIDGFSHHRAEQRRRDLRAGARLVLRGYTVLRFDYVQVLLAPDEVIGTISEPLRRVSTADSALTPPHERRRSRPDRPEPLRSVLPRRDLLPRCGGDQASATPRTSNSQASSKARSRQAL